MPSQRERKRKVIETYTISMLREYIRAYCQYVIHYIEESVNTKLWVLKFTLILSLIAVTTSFPDYYGYVMDNSSGDNIITEAINWQIAHPLQQLPEEYTFLPEEKLTGAPSHLDKRWSRITVPLLAYIFHLDVFLLIILQHITSVLFFYLLLNISFDITADRVISLLIGFIFATTFVGKWGFQDFHYYDGIAYFLLLLAMWKKNVFIVFFGILLAGFTDERALIASAMIYLWWHLRENHFQEIDFKSFLRFDALKIAIISAWVAYFLIRYFVLIQYFQLKPGVTGLGLEPLRYNFKYIPMGFFTFLEFAWLLIFAAYVLLLSNKRYLFSILLFLASGLSYTTAFLVFDVSRSMGYAYPILLISLLVLYQSKEKDLKKYLLIVGTLCFLLPTHAVFLDEIKWFSPIIPKIFKFF